jgi:hypothetical protein
LPSVALAGKYSVWSVEGLPSTFGAGSRKAGGLVGSGPVGWWPSGAVGRQAGGWAVALWQWWPACSFSVSWCGEDFHRLGAQGVEVSALPCALPQPSVSPVSQQGPCFTEFTLSVSVSQSSFWIPEANFVFLILPPVKKLIPEFISIEILNKA